MKYPHWSDDERTEHDAAADEAWRTADGTAQRVATYERLLLDAEQAARRWAVDVLADARRVGLLTLLKAHVKRQRSVRFHYHGQQIERPEVIGTRRKNVDGSARFVQMSIFDLSWEDLRSKRDEARTAQDAYGANIIEYDRLLALEARVPEARTPREACERLRMSPDEWLGAA